MDNTKVPFQVVRGTEQAIIASCQSANGIYPDGIVYFATDTRKIFYGNGTSSLTPMGGNSGIFYGMMQYSETPEEDQVNFDFYPEDIEGDSLPNVDDLIFNSPDKSFYRVLDVEGSGMNSIIRCKRLAVSGGGGSGGGSGGSSGSAGRLVLSRIGEQTINILQNGKCYIKFRYSAVDGSGENTGAGQGVLSINGAIVKTFSVVQGENQLEIGEYLKTADTYSVNLAVSGSIGTSSNERATKIWTVIVNSLNLSWNYNENTINDIQKPLSLAWTVSTGLDYITHLMIDNIYSIDIPKIGNAREQNYSIQNISTVGLMHGAYTIEMYVTTEIGGETYRSNSIYHNVICVDKDRTDTIISVNLQQDTMRQYDTLTIPIIVYNPNSENGKISISLRENSIEKDIWTDYDNGKTYIWNYTPIEAGIKTLTIVSGGIEKNIRLLVEDIGVNIAEIKGYDFKFKASDITSNNALQNWSFNNEGIIKPSFSNNFDWINGGLKNELDNNNKLRNYINIKAGTTMSFNFKPFSNINKNTGYTLKIIFKATNCRVYDGTILTIGSPRLNDSIYLQLTANEGQYKSGTSTLLVPYCENSYIEFEIDISPYDVKDIVGKDQPVNISYITSWLDGVPASIANYAQNDNFNQNNPRDIVIGSNDCDVQLYMIKCYPKHLTDEQHLTNFIMDAPNAEEMIKRYLRNDILDDTGEISYRKLAKNNPNCDVYTYDIPRMTINKKNKITGCSYARYREKENPQQTATNVTISVQGTSSAAYGLAAFNLDSEFTEGFIDFSNDSTVGTPIEKWSMTPNSMPVNYFNTKVNVASCEQANNAINQEWYDRYVPFETEYHYKMRTNPDNTYIPRNTIEFPTMGVLFIRDHNAAKDNPPAQGVSNNVFNDTEGYIDNPYYKLYSICNMGNSKKNKEVFTDPDNPYEVIMEVSDNQQPQQWMTSTEGLIRDNTAEEFVVTTQDADGNDVNITVYEWRNKPKSNKMVEANNAWLDLVQWFADNNPSAATEELLPEPVTFGDYTFKGYKSAITGYEPENQILKGLKISTYAGTYTHDTYKYRMAKMLSECEDHLIMDAMVFHYLFIERHCLIDNVAKNTFWHTEDLQHWSMIKDYDNDTSDGNDNSGHLTLTYGYEVLDHVHHNDNEGMVFNASPSVWLHFIHGLLDARTHMYQALDDKITNKDTSSVHGAWKAQPYLEEFEKWQSAIPERVWIEAYYRLYKRPLEVYGDDSFLPRLEGGKKTHQRKQFEIYQQEYMASEYFGAECRSSKIDIRANGSDISNEVIPMTMYADGYIRVAPGTGDNAVIRQRVRGGQKVNIQLPVSDATDMTTYFYSAHYITSMENIAALKPKSIGIAGASKMRILSVNGIDSSNNENLESATFGNNTMLESLEVCNCPNIKNALDLSTATGLQNLDIRGSGFTSINIADNAPVKRLALNDPSILYLNNVHDIEEFSMDYSKLEGLYLNNIDDNIGINSQTLVSNAVNNYKAVDVADLEVFNSGIYYIKNDEEYEVATVYNDTVQYYKPTFSFYSLQNVNWNFDNPNDIIDNKIKLLETIYNTGGAREISGLHNSTSSNLALTGIAYITQNAYNDAQSIDIYDRYAIEQVNGSTRFANLDLNFLGDQAQLCLVSVLDGNENVKWHKKAVGNYEINESFLSSGVEGAIDYSIITHKPDSASEVFTFANQWKIFNKDNDLIATIDSPTISYTPSAEDREEITIVPVFTSVPRKYEISFTLPNNEVIVKKVEYNTTILDIAPIDIVKDESDLEIDETYQFKGWSLRSDSSSIINNSVVAQGAMTLFAIFDKIKVRSNINLNLFKIVPIDETNTTETAPVILYPNDNVILTGKITIPTFFNNHPIVALAEFNAVNGHSITHVFFQDPAQSKVTTINGGCFSELESLIYFEWPENLESIGLYAFYGTNLQVDLIPNEINTYNLANEKLTYIDQHAFQGAFVSNTSGYYVKIPSSVVTIGYAAFGWEDNFKNCTFILGTELNPSKWDAQINPGNDNNKGEGYNEGTGHRFSQNDYNISLIFYSSKYNYKTDRIPQNTERDDVDFTIADAIQSQVSHLALSGNLK